MNGLIALILISTALGSGSEPSTLPPGHPRIDEAAPSGVNANARLPSGHPQVKEGAPARSAEDLLKQLDASPNLKERVKSFEIASSIGKLYYGSGRFSDAATFLAMADKFAEPARTLFLQERKKLGKKGVPVADAGRCGTEAQESLEKQVEGARKKVIAGDAESAAACLRSALDPWLEISQLRANTLFLTGDGPGALASYERCLQASENRSDCLFGHASVLFDTQGNSVPALRRAKSEWESYLRLNPNASKKERVTKLLQRTEQAIAAGGASALASKRAAEAKSKMAAAAASPPGRAPGANDSLPPVTPEMMQAIQNTERTPELQQGLAKLVEEGEEHLARGRYQEALDAYKRVVPFQPENGRAKAGMAWAMVGLKRQPMADRIWSVAVSADPAAVDKLGDTLTAKGDRAGAQALWSKLASSDPSYAERAALDKKLR